MDDEEGFGRVCRNACEGLTHASLWDNAPFIKERRAIGKLGVIDGSGREAFESWDCETKAVAIVQRTKWPDRARVAVGRIRKPFLSLLWE